MLVTPFALACTHCDGSYGPLMAVVAPEGHPPSRRDERLPYQAYSRDAFMLEERDTASSAVG
jgi:hypothetical protein